MYASMKKPSIDVKNISFTLKETNLSIALGGGGDWIDLS